LKMIVEVDNNVPREILNMGIILFTIH
jgi:hypothetical protein